MSDCSSSAWLLLLLLLLMESLGRGHGAAHVWCGGRAYSGHSGGW